MATSIAELVIRTLFFASVITAVVLMPWEFAIAALVVALLRYFVVMFVVVRNARRLGEGGVIALHFVYDIIEPMLRPAIALASHKKFKKSWF